MRLRPLLLASALVLPVFAACGSDDDSGGKPKSTGGTGGGDASAGSGGSSAGSGGSSATGGGGTGGGIVTDGGGCAGGCDGGVCIGGQCCAATQACGSACCGTGDVCSFEKCVTPGLVCVDAGDCASGQYCEYSLGDPATSPDGGTDAGADGGPSCQGGASLATGKCLPKPPECATGAEPKPGEPLTCLAKCEYKPTPAAFDPKLKAHWDKGDIMMSPIVVQLDDDNCDQKVDERDIPEIVFSTFAGGKYNENGTLWVVSLVDGKLVEKWSKNPTVDPIHPGRSIAGGNIDGVAGNEVVVCTTAGKVRAYKADGSDLWTSPAAGCVMPSLGDLDGDGLPEVVVEGGVLNGATGAMKYALTPAGPGNFVLSDMDGDGKLDIVTPTRIHKGSDGTLLADSGLAGTYVAVGDFDKDGTPEVASINKPIHQLSVWRYDATATNKVKVLRTGIDINGTFANTCPAGSSGNTTGGGPPTIADFNGDQVPDVAVAGGIGYAVIDGSKVLNAAVPANQTLLWLTKTQDCSSAATGSSLFDFEGDGTPEVVYSDEQYFRIYKGTDGSVLWSTCNTTGTLVEYPLVADVDNDGGADIVVVSNAYSSIVCPKDNSKQRGLRVFGDDQGKWVRTRRVWNQHAYHVTNVDEDGTIPKNELPNWTQPRLNNFRQNVQPLGEFSAPDLIVSVFPRCVGTYAVVARVRNIGQASVPAKVTVGFYAGDPASGGTLLGTGFTTKALYPAEAEDVVLELPGAPADVKSGATPLFAVVDDGSPAHSWVECRTDNNKSAGANGKCQGGPS